jgi:GT2 family glycosyltransferase
LIVTSRGLLEKHSRRGLHPVLVRNAVDFEFFSTARPEALLAQIQRPVVGYFGAIAEWFDYDLIAHVAKSRPNYSFVLIGGLGLESEAQGKKIRQLGALPNVHLLGHKPYALIPSYLAEFDACVVPFVRNQVTTATDPVKLYEYFSQGKPVVTTAMAELANLGELAYIATDAGDFSRKLDAALSEQDTDLGLRRIRFASENTWGARCDAMEGALLGSFPMVSVVIVSHNSAEHVAPCLNSLKRNTIYPRWELIVVDNASQDATADLVKQAAKSDSRIRLIRQSGNVGFAAGNNIGVRAARGECIILLNMDTVVSHGWMERLLRHARKDPSVGMVVPVTNSAGNEVRINVRYADLQEMEEFALSLARDNMGIGLDIRMGPLFCALIPRAVWSRVGELDERFEVGMFEDDDYSHRLAKAGYRIVSAEDCFVHHFGQGAFSKLPHERYQAIFDQNRRRFEEKWGFSWIPHKYRPGVSGEGRRYTPADFVLAGRIARGPERDGPGASGL